MPEPEWARVVDGMRLGDHAILLYNDVDGLAPPVVHFVVSGLNANELVVCLLPVGELAKWRGIVDEALRQVAGGEGSGSLQIIPLLPSRLTEDTGPLDVVSLARRMLKEAKADGRTGVRVVGRLAPALLDSGFERNAIAIEKFVQEQKIPMKILCLYEAPALAKASPSVMNEIVQAHTQSIAHVAEDVYLVEAL